MKFTLVSDSDGSKTLTVLVDGNLLSASTSHPQWDRLVAGVLADDESVADLFALDKAVASKFQELSDRVAVQNGQILLDGDPVDNALTQQVLRFLDEGVDDWVPLVNFFEKIQANPSENSKNSLYRWLSDRNFTIYPDGDVLFYKSVQSVGGDIYESITGGKAFVNGVEQTGKIRQQIGDVVTMPRSSVDPDVNSHCSVGLHAGNHRYASTFSGDTLLEVKVNPVNVIAVPTDSQSEKVRTCKYEIVGVVEKEYQEPVSYGGWEGYAEDEFDQFDYGDDQDEVLYPYGDGADLPVYRDTRDNYTRQVRDSRGRFVPKS